MLPFLTESAADVVSCVIHSVSMYLRMYAALLKANMVTTTLDNHVEALCENVLKRNW